MRRTIASEDDHSQRGPISLRCSDRRIKIGQIGTADEGLSDEKCQIVSGNILNGGHRIIVVGINCRDNCSSVAIALGSALDFAVTDLTRAAEDSAVGRFVKLAIQRPPTEEIIGLVLRMDHRRPVRLEDLRSAIRHLMQYLGARQDLSPRDVAMVAIGTGAARIEGGLFLNTSSDATLLRLVLEIAAGVDAKSAASTASASELQADVRRHGMTPLFTPGVEGI